jgi:beta-lactamase class D OXA-29
MLYIGASAMWMLPMFRILFFIISFISVNVFANESCFIASENGKVIIQEGECSKRYGPQSTFKIPLALMGYDSGVFQDENNPEWEFREGYDRFLKVCESAHTPKTWMRDSCVWYSQVLTTKLGEEKFQNYIHNFQYGNMDVSGDEGKNNGLTHSWLSSSLKISPEEQIAFIFRFLRKRLHVSNSSYGMAKRIFYHQTIYGGWKLYGKTGNGVKIVDGKKTELQQGWFVGWIERGDRKIVFANHVVDDKKEDVFASFRARNDTMNRLFYLIESLEK